MQQALKLEDYARIVRRRLPLIVGIFLPLALAVVSIVQSLPAVYRSTGKIAVESQQIPADLVQSTVRGGADERIAFIQQILMTDANVEQIIAKFDLYRDDLAGEPMVKVVKKLRDHVLVEAVRDPFTRSQAAIAFTVSFEHTNPETARDVAELLVERFLAENTRSRNARASDTAGFLRQEAGRLSEQVRSLEKKVAEFKQQHSDSLPEHLDLRVSTLQNVEFDLRAVQREISASEQEKRILATQGEAIAALSPSGAGAARTEMSPEKRLRVLRSELAESSALYTDAHPDVIRLKRMIASAEMQTRAHREEAGESGVAPELDPEGAQIESRIASADARLAALRAQERDLRDRMEELEAQILKTPEVERGLRELAFNYDSALDEYKGVRSKLQQAELAEDLESKQMAERFVLLEPPAVPVVPVRPSKLKLILMGFVLALGVGAGAAFAAEMMDNRIRDPIMLTSLLGTRPLAIVPYIELGREQRRRSISLLVQWSVFLAMLGAASVLVYHENGPIRELLGRWYY